MSREVSSETARSLTLQKHQAIYARFVQLYNQKRMRYDDVLHQLSQEFFMQQYTVERIIRKLNAQQQKAA